MNVVSTMYAGTGAPRQAATANKLMSYTPSAKAARASSISPSTGFSIKSSYDKDADSGSSGVIDTSGDYADFTEFNKDKANTDMGREEFLAILLAQLQNQDPLDPMDGEEFVAQLAVFSQLEQQMNTNDLLEVIASYESSINASQSMNLLGSDIKAVGSQVTIRKGESTPITYVLPEGGDVIVKVYDDEGEVLREIDVGYRAAGQHEYSWDGLDDNGEQVPDGSYKIAVIGYNDNDLPMTDVTVVSQGPVTGLTFDDDGVPVLLVGSYDPTAVDSEGNPIDNRIGVYLSAVLEVSTPDQSTSSDDDSVPDDELISSAASAAAAAGFKFGRPTAKPSSELGSGLGGLIQRLAF